MNRLFLFISLIYFSCANSFSQVATSLDGQTLDLFTKAYRSASQDDEKFIFMADGIGASYDSDDGEWESVKYDLKK